MKRLALLFMLGMLPVLALPRAASAALEGPLHTILWNNVEQVLVIDSTAISISRSGLSLASWDDSLKLFVTTHTEPLDIRPTGARLCDSLLVVKTEDFRLIAWDVHSFPDLNPIWTAQPNRDFADFFIDGNRLYLTSWFDGLWRYALDGNGGLVFEDSSMVGILVSQMEADDDHLYVLDEYNGLMRYDRTQLHHGRISEAFVDYLYVTSEIGSFVVADSLAAMLPRSGGIVMGRIAGALPVASPLVAESLRPRSVFVSGDDLVAVLPRGIEVRDRATGSLRDEVEITGLDPDGTLFTAGGTRYFVLPRLEGGLYLLNLDEPIRRGPGLYRAGPVKSLALLGDRLLTGGGSNPIDVFHLLPGTLEPELEYTMFPKLTGAQALEVVGDSVITYYAGLNRIAVVLEADNPDSFFLERSFTLADTLAGKMQFLPRFREDSLRAIVAVGAIGLQAYLITDSGFIDPAPTWYQHGRISAALVHDSFLFVGTVKRQLWTYRIDSTFQVQHIATSDLTGVPQAILWAGDRLILFLADQMLVFDVAEDGTPQLASSLPLPVTVLDAAISGDRIYTIGGSGIGLFGIDSNGIELLEHGGDPGRLLAVRGSVLAASDGGSVKIYRLDADDGPGPGPLLPLTPRLAQNYPNPFNGETIIRFALPAAGHVRLTVYNLLGQRVATLIDGHMPAGDNQAVWDGSDGAGNSVATGVYLYRLEAGSASESRKMLLIK